ncbi:hypothetical protein J5N97_018315 [Dioscorea zingiberensis]|uniref:ER membrane protein complex subunit 10 n=1 Tax=Dioscorea zingiberensis TaxID=325984 RepID=A0A9D5HH51_9LILI|nr:hypothetical protein J5N97_018315 [Dioscorea zingiberensis]
MSRRKIVDVFLLLLVVSFSLFFARASASFESDELLLQDDEEFGLEGARSPDLEHLNPIRLPIRRKSDLDSSSSSDSKAIQFNLEHAFGDSGFSPAGTFTARLKSWSHGGQTLTKLRFSKDDFYTIRVPSNVLSPPGKDYIVSSIKARCLPRETLDEHFVIHTEGVNILAVNYGSAGVCQYPRLLKLWSFNSYTVLKNGEQAPRTPTFAEELHAGENGEGEGVKPPEKSFWAKYWMYLIPLGLIVMNAVTQATNMPEEQAGGQSGTQAPQAVAQRGPTAAVRRR